MLAYHFRYRHVLPLFLEHPAVPLANVQQHIVVVQPVKVGYSLNKKGKVLLTIPDKSSVLLRQRHYD